jgi:hypothetical protein
VLEGSAVVTRRGGSLQTFSGREVWPLDPRPEDLCIEDIAHALALQCRFGGHTRQHYSVAEHSVRGLEALPNRVPSSERAFLLHDAAEAYLVDIPSPLKRELCCAWYREVEAQWERCIEVRFGLGRFALASPDVKHADEVMLATEQRDLRTKPPPPRPGMPAPLPHPILQPMRWEAAERTFLQEFERLFLGGCRA